jgi:ESCRT-II complex subunit VPS36
MFLKHIDLTTALRPYLPEEESLVFVQDNVGLYEGYIILLQEMRSELLLTACRKFKIPDHQNGHVYLTSHRVCYVDNDDPRKNSVAIELKEVDRFEFYVRCRLRLRLLEATRH